MRGPSRSATTRAASVRRVFLGIDCGTQSTKVVLRDAEDGSVLALGRADHAIVERDDGTREQDPAWWTRALVSAAREALRAGASRGQQYEIAGIGVSGQQH